MNKKEREQLPLFPELEIDKTVPITDPTYLKENFFKVKEKKDEQSK